MDLPLLYLMLTMSPLSLKHFKTSLVLSFTTSLSLMAKIISPASNCKTKFNSLVGIEYFR